MYQLVRLALIMVVSLFAVGAAGAPVAYSVNSDSGSANQDSLYLIDLATGTEDLKGKLLTGIPDDARKDTEGLAIAPDGTLWGVDDESRTLFPINKEFGFVKISEEAPLTSFPPQSQYIGGHDFGMTFSCDNILYLVSVQTRTLHKQNLDGSSEVIGVTGALGANISAIAAYGNPTQLYGIGNGTLENGEVDSPNLYRIEVTGEDAGVAKMIGPMGMGTSFSNYDQAGLAFDTEGILWAITDRRIINDKQAANQPSEILRIDLETGAATHVATTSEIGFESLAIAPPSACTVVEDPIKDEVQAVPIPALDPAGRWLAIFVILLSGSIAVRRKFS
jgi:hypothetical protein